MAKFSKSDYKNTHQTNVVMRRGCCLKLEGKIFRILTSWLQS